MSLWASVLHLSRADIKELRVTDIYSLHRIVYDLFDDIRTDEDIQSSSGILFADQGGDMFGRKVLLLSMREPRPSTQDGCGHVLSKRIDEQFLQHPSYRYKVLINPTRREKISGKLQPIRSRQEIADWFSSKSQAQWGFAVHNPSLQVNQINVLQFKGKAQRTITLAQAEVSGVLTVTNRDAFIQAFSNGLGRGKAFGCGLLQLSPITISNLH